MASVIKGKSDQKAAQKQANQQYANDVEAAKLQRQWQLEDREEERAYNRKELDETRAYSRDVLKHLVEDATEAGFNPAFVAGAGAAGSYNAAAGLAPLSATPITRQAPVKQAVRGSSGIGDFVGGAAGDFLQRFDPFADQKREQEYRLVESQISALNASTLSGVPYGRGSYAQGDFERRPSGKAGVLGKPTPPDVGQVNVTNPWSDYEVDPKTRDAAAFEERYGEVGGSVLGGAVFVQDLAWNIKKKVGPYIAPIAGALYRSAGANNRLPSYPKPKKKSQPRATGGGGGW